MALGDNFEDADYVSDTIYALQRALIADIEDGVSTVVVTGEQTRGTQKGRAYLASRRKPEVANGETYNLYVSNPSDSGVFLEFSTIQFEGEGKTGVTVYENVTVDTAGTTIIPDNNRIGSSNTSNADVQLDIGWSNGELRAEEYSLTADRFSIGSAKGNTVSPVLEPGNSILIELTNISAATVDMDFETTWNEHPADEYPSDE